MNPTSNTLGRKEPSSCLSSNDRARRSMRVDSLESRPLLAGITLIAIGFTPELLGSLELPARPLAMEQPTDTRQLSASLRNDSFGSDQEVVLLFNWIDESPRIKNGSLTPAADSFIASLMHKNETRARDLDRKSSCDLAFESIGNLHNVDFIGPGCSAVLNSLGTERVAAWFNELKIERVTSLALHPEVHRGDPGSQATPLGDSRLPSFSSVVFAENYTRQAGVYEGNWKFKRVPANGANAPQLSVIDLDNKRIDAAAQPEVHAWYAGTVMDTLPGDYAVDCDVGGSNRGALVTTPEAWSGGIHPNRCSIGFQLLVVEGRSALRGRVLGAESLAGSIDVVASGDLDAISSFAYVLPGWESQAGGARTISVGAPHEMALQLEPTGRFTSIATSRIHHRQYIPSSANLLRYDWRTLASGTRANVLEVQVNGLLIDRLDLDTVSPVWNSKRVVMLPDSVRGTTGNIEFSISNIAAQSVADATIQIDNITIESGGKTGDIIPVKLQTYLDTPVEFVLQRIEAIAPKTAAIKTAFNLLGDLELTDDSGISYGTIVFPERLSGQRPFGQSGRFDFVPGVERSVVHDTVGVAAGFQGNIRIHYVTSETLSGVAVEQKLALDVHVYPG